MILRKKLSWQSKPSRKLKQADLFIEKLYCPKCNGRGFTRRAPDGRYSTFGSECRTCIGKGIPPIPMSELYESSSS